MYMGPVDSLGELITENTFHLVFYLEINYTHSKYPYFLHTILVETEHLK